MNKVAEIGSFQPFKALLHYKARNKQLVADHVGICCENGTLKLPLADIDLLIADLTEIQRKLQSGDEKL